MLKIPMMLDKNKEKAKKKLTIEKVNTEKEPEKDEILKKEMNNFFKFNNLLGLTLSYNYKQKEWIENYFEIDLKYLFPKLNNQKKHEEIFTSLSECTSKQEIEKIMESQSNDYLFFEIYSEYIENKIDKCKLTLNKYHFIYYNGDPLIKRQVFSNRINIKRIYNINKNLNLNKFVFYCISLDDFTQGFWGIALRRYRNIEYMEFDKMKNFLRCQKCHTTTKLTLDNFINSNQNTVEAYYKCPKCGEVYSFSKLKKIYEENMRNAY